MRRLLPLVLVLASCTNAAGDTTTVPLAEPSTTSTTAPTTTTTEPTTTTTIEECVDRDGILRTRKGFVCPPHMDALAYPGGDLYQPGRYVTRVFTPPLAFTSARPFPSAGESVAVVELTADPKPTVIGTEQNVIAFGPPLSAYFADLASEVPTNKPGGWAWAVDPTTSSTTVAGHRAMRSEFTTRCEEDEITISTDLLCVFEVPGLDFWNPDFAEGDRVVTLQVDVPGGPVTILVRSPDTSFDSYWTEVAQPILDSIEFVDS